MSTVIYEGTPPEGLPLPVLVVNLSGRKYVELRGKHYIIDVFPYPGDGELCWKAYKWDGLRWLRIPCFTRAEENRFPKTIARMATEFTHKLQAIESGAMAQKVEG